MLHERRSETWLVGCGLVAVFDDLFGEWRVWDGERRLPSARLSDVDPLSDAQRIFKFDAEITNRAVHLGVAEQKLDRA